jgi:hypothetical protein
MPKATSQQRTGFHSMQSEVMSLLPGSRLCFHYDTKPIEIDT